MKTLTGKFSSFDQQQLFYRQWQHEEKFNGKILIILHRGHEHSKRLSSIAAKKEFSGYRIYSYDNRGHGETEVEATYEFMDLVRDLNAFVQFVCNKENVAEEQVFIIANSVAGVVASTWVHDYAPNIRGLALIAPAFKIKLYAPFASSALKMAIKFKPDLNIKSYVKAKFLTHNKTEQALYNDDKLITPNIPARLLTSLLDTAKRIVDDAQLIATATLVLSASKDYVVDTKIQGDFYARLGSKHKKFVDLEGFYHGVLYENDSQLAIDEISDFINKCFHHTIKRQDKQLIKYTSDEKDKIAHGSLTLAQSLNYLLQKKSMQAFGNMSNGMNIGLKYGFDSGVTLDYIYKNQANGSGLMGKIMDKNYLNSIGWQGIRQRKIHMIEMIEKKITLLKGDNQTIKILDIAGGPARYLIELAEKYPDIEIQVRDYQTQNIDEGISLAETKSLRNISYVQHDAFDSKNYNKDEYEPNIVIISGFFELFSDNSMIQQSIDGVLSIMAEGDFLIYTGQPWHPQLEQIAHVLGNHQKEKWIMRRRSQYELDQLFNASGFEKEDMLIDNWGIFSVSSAKCVGSHVCL